MIIDKNQGVDRHGNKFGYVAGDNGGYFFTHFDNIEEVVDSVEIDEIDGDGGLDKQEVVKFLRYSL